ncbi:MAG: FtsX-like permease family protein [Gemmatimonadota bacterium]|nr:FtsX-like permease family protein [Gemmatimonadota bacterium]
MKLLTRSSLRHLASHRTQLVLSVLGVALGVGVVVAIDLAIQSARTGFEISAETVSGRATHQIVSDLGSVDEGILRKLRVDLGIRQAAPVVEAVGASSLVPGRALTLLGVDPFSEGPFRPYVAGSGGELDVSGFVATPYAVVLSSETAEGAGVEVGDTLPFTHEGRAYPLTVVGTLEPQDRLARIGLSDVLLVDVASAQDLLDMSGRLSRIDVRLPEGAEGERAAERVRRSLPDGARLETAGTRTEAMSGMIRAFDLNLTALSLLALIFGMFLIYNAMTFSVVQRRGLLGRLRALGVGRGEIVRMILREAFWIGAVGAAFGLVIGVVLGRGLVRLVTRTINDLYFTVSVQGVGVDPGVLVKGALLGVGATVLAALPPALEAASVSPRLATLRSASEERARRGVPKAARVGVVLGVVGGVLMAIPSRSLLLSFTALFLVILGMALLTPLGTVVLVSAARPLLRRLSGLLGSMAARGVVTSLSRTAPAVAALVIAVSVTVGLGVMIQSFRGTLIQWLDGTLQADVYVSVPGPRSARATGTLERALIDTVVTHPDVAGHSTYRAIDVVVPEGPYRLVALDLDPRGEDAFDFLSGSPDAAMRAFREGSGVIVSEPFAFRRGLDVGDSVSVRGSAGSRSLEIAGVFYDYGAEEGTVMMDRELYDRLHEDEGVTSLALFLEEGTDAERVVAELLARVPEGRTLTVRTDGALREASLAVFDRTFRVTGVLRLLAFIVAFVGVLSALMALELERAREFGVLRAVGLTPDQVRRLVLTQTGLLGLVSGILAIPVGLVLSWVMIFVVNKRSFGWTLGMEVGPEVLVQAVALALVGALVAGVYPAWRLAKAEPALALRGE